MEVKLIIVGDSTTPANEFALQLPTVVGRSRTADLALANPLVSRQHCEIFEADGQLMVRDLGSLNGTFIGKTRIEAESPSALAPGGLLTVGAVTFRAEYAGANGAAPASGSPAPVRAAAQIGSDDATVDVDDLESLEPLAAAGGDDDEFSLSWLENSSSSPPAAATEAAAAKKTVPAESPAPAKKAAAKASASQGKVKPAANSDSLDDLCQ